MADETDEALLDRIQRAAFDYFVTYCNPDNGLIADSSDENAPCSIAAVGFALSCYPVAVSRGWMERADALQRTLATLRFFAESEQGESPAAIGAHGFYRHFLLMRTGKPAWDSEVSLIDTTLLLAGMLMASVFFDGDGEEEAE